MNTANSAVEARQVYDRLSAQLPPPPLWRLAQANREWLLAVEAEREDRERRSVVRRVRK